MTQEEKSILLKDLCARLPYEPMCEFTDTEDNFCKATAKLGYSFRDFVAGKIIIKPYLRPMSSMTEEEEKELEKITPLFNFNRLENIIYVGNRDDGFCFLTEMEEIITFLNAHYFDYRGLIEKGLAIEASDGMYK